MTRIVPSLLAAVSAGLVLAASANAHEIWIERDASGETRIYLGEPEFAMPEGGDPEFHRLTAPRVFGTDRDRTVPTARADGYLTVKEPVAGDVRLIDDRIFDPWQDAETTVGVVYYARAGRTQTEAGLPLGFAPVQAGSDRFTLTFEGEPLEGASVSVIAPGRWKKTIETDAEGRVTVPTIGQGRYLLTAIHQAPGAGIVKGQPVDAVMHVSTLTFTR